MTDTLNDNKKENLYVVQFGNWQIIVPITDHNLSFDIETQMYEAGSRAVEVFKGYNKYNLNIIPNANNTDELSLGGACLVYLKGGGAEKGLLLFTGILLADGGYYKDSADVIKKTEAHLNSFKNKANSELDGNKIQKQLDEYQTIIDKNKKKKNNKDDKKTPKKKIRKKKDKGGDSDKKD